MGPAQGSSYVMLSLGPEGASRAPGASLSDQGFAAVSHGAWSTWRGKGGDWSPFHRGRVLVHTSLSFCLLTLSPTAHGRIIEASGGAGGGVGAPS